MPLTDPKLWELIRTWPLPFREEVDDLDPPKRTCTRFEHNLRKIGDWTDEATEKITAAYRRFLYLKALTGETLTPPTWVDQAWHLHMEFPEDYAALEVAVGRPIAHWQDLSAVERTKAFDRGRQLWISEFDEFPEKTIWPTLQSLRREMTGYAIFWVGGASFLVFWLAGFGLAVLARVEAPSSIGIGFIVSIAVACVGGFVIRNRAPKTISRCG
jgi:hypothetical protein